MKLPHQVRIDASTACQLRCPSCPTTQGIIRDRLGTGHLDPARFENFLEENPQIRAVELSNWGEILLNPRLPELLELAARRGVGLSARNGVNLNTVSDETLQALVQYRLENLLVSIDGATQATYRRYRVRGDLDTVIANLRRLQELKREADSEYPRVSWQYIVFDHNVHEIEDAKRLADELGVRLFLKPSWDEELAPRSDEFRARADALGVPYLDGLSENGAAQGLGFGSTVVASADRKRRSRVQTMLEKARKAPSIHDAVCRQLWDAPQLNHDGRVLGCCVNTWQDFGNAFEESFAAIFTGDRMTRARDLLTGRGTADADLPCTTCRHYETLRDSAYWLEPRD